MPPLACPPSPPGGHNVIIGLHDYLQRWHPGSTLLGFLNGPRGVMQNNYKVLTPEELVRRRGGAEQEFSVNSVHRFASSRCQKAASCGRDRWRLVKERQAGWTVVQTHRPCAAHCAGSRPKRVHKLLPPLYSFLTCRTATGTRAAST